MKHFSANSKKRANFNFESVLNSCYESSRRISTVSEAIQQNQISSDVNDTIELLKETNELIYEQKSNNQELSQLDARKLNSYTVFGHLQEKENLDSLNFSECPGTLENGDFFKCLLKKLGYAHDDSTGAIIVHYGTETFLPDNVITQLRVTFTESLTVLLGTHKTMHLSLPLLSFLVHDKCYEYYPELVELLTLLFDRVYEGGQVRRLAEDYWKSLSNTFLSNPLLFSDLTSRLPQSMAGFDFRSCLMCLFLGIDLPAVSTLSTIIEQANEISKVVVDTDRIFTVSFLVELAWCLTFFTEYQGSLMVLDELIVCFQKVYSKVRDLGIQEIERISVKDKILRFINSMKTLREIRI